LRIVALFHGRIKRVHIHVYDFPSGHRSLFYDDQGRGVNRAFWLVAVKLWLVWSCANAKFEEFVIY
jgi:hypothetical protein